MESIPHDATAALFSVPVFHTQPDPCRTLWLSLSDFA